MPASQRIMPPHGPKGRFKTSSTPALENGEPATTPVPPSRSPSLNLEELFNADETPDQPITPNLQSLTSSLFSSPFSSLPALTPSPGGSSPPIPSPLSAPLIAPSIPNAQPAPQLMNPAPANPQPAKRMATRANTASTQAETYGGWPQQNPRVFL